jgi:uncharacterized protein
MITFETKVEAKLNYPINIPYELDDIIFFDIETTGLSANTSYLYLIGCMFYKDNTWNMIQWFADDMASESLIIESFSQKIKSYKRLIHFNGSGFDIPFILKKCQQHNIPNPFEGIESFDIYRKLNPYKKKLPLANLKLKTIENYIHIHRDDLYSGEELIQIYANYLGKVQYERLHERTQNKISANIIDKSIPLLLNQTNKSQNPSSNELLNTLLLHNLEDIKGLIKVADMLLFVDFLESFTQESLQKNHTQLFRLENITKSEDNTNVLFDMLLPYELPNAVNWSLALSELTNTVNDNLDKKLENLEFKLEVFENRIRLKIPIYHGELKVFYENYREYYYLPIEDYAIHQSIAQYVDKEYRVKAKPATCYTKISGSFIPQPGDIYLPTLKTSYTDKINYFDINNLFLDDSSIYDYINSILNLILTNKKTELITK